MIASVRSACGSFSSLGIQASSRKASVAARIIFRFIALFFVTPSSSLCLQAQTDTLRLSAAEVRHTPAHNGDMVSANSLSGEQLQELRAHSVADALRYFSGVQIKDYGGVGGLKTINVRAMGSQHVGVVLDGVALSQAQNGTIDLGRFSLEELERLTLYNGHHTSLLQPAANFAAASALFIESRRPTFPLSDTRRFYHTRVAVRTGSFGALQTTLRTDVRLAENIAASVGGGYVHSDGNYAFRYRVVGAYDTTGVRRNSDIDALRLEAALCGSSLCDDWRVKAYLYASERGLPGAVVRGRTTSGDRQWDANLFLQAYWRHQIFDNYQTLTTAKMAYDRLRFTNDPIADPATIYVDNIYRTASFYLSSAHRLTLHHFSLAVAGDYRAERMLANLYDFPNPTRHTAYLSVAAETRLSGLRLQGNLLSTLVYDHTSQASSVPRRTELSPFLSISYRCTEHSPLVVRAFAKRIFRMPTLCDLYYTLVGNSALRPERTAQLDIGSTWELFPTGLFRRGEISVDAYYNKVHDKIVAIPGASMFRWTMLNLGSVSVQGVEMCAQSDWQFGNVCLALRATYTYERARDVTDRADAFYGHQIPYIPRHSGSFIAHIDWRDFSVRYSFLYTGKRYDQRANTPENFCPAWYTSDIAISYNYRAFRLTAEVNNIFQQRYELVKGYPLPGRNFFLSLSWGY